MHPTQAGPVSTANQTKSQAVAVIGCIDAVLPASDRAAATLAVTRFSEVVVCSPNGDEAALRYALGAGSTSIANSLDHCEAHVYLIGRGGAGVEGELTAARLATARGAALVLDVLDVQWANENLRVERDLGRGAREILILSGPAVLLMSDDAPQPIYVSCYRRRAVELPKKIVENDVRLSIPWEPVRLRTKTADLADKTSGDARTRLFDAFGLNDDAQSDVQHIVAGDAETCAQHLVRYLAHHGFIDRPFDVVAMPTTVPSPSATPTMAEPAVASKTFVPRGPRPLGSNRPPGRRGPFPCMTPEDSIDG
jgi:electron transfer flavoprotein alpha/beta subunit